MQAARTEVSVCYVWIWLMLVDNHSVLLLFLVVACALTHGVWTPDTTVEMLTKASAGSPQPIAQGIEHIF